MPTTYRPKPPVICFNCGDEMVKRRNSKSGRYYCPKAACQNERRADWMRDRSDGRVRVAEDTLEAFKTVSAAFVRDALHNAHATCPDCGATEVPNGWAHFNAAGEGCGGLGLWNGTVNIQLVEAVWPESARKYVQ